MEIKDVIQKKIEKATSEKAEKKPLICHNCDRNLAADTIYFQCSGHHTIFCESCAKDRYAVGTPKLVAWNKKRCCYIQYWLSDFAARMSINPPPMVLTCVYEKVENVQ